MFMAFQQNILPVLNIYCIITINYNFGLDVPFRVCLLIERVCFYSTSIIMDGKLIHIGYKKFKQELFVLALPANR